MYEQYLDKKKLIDSYEMNMHSMQRDNDKKHVDIMGYMASDGASNRSTTERANKIRMAPRHITLGVICVVRNLFFFFNDGAAW